MARKIMAGIVIGLAALLLVASIVGIALIWIYRTPLTQQAIDRLQAIQTELTQAQTALDHAKAELERTLRLVDAAQTTLDALGKELGVAKGLFEEINAVLDTTVLPSLQSSRGKVDDVKSSLTELRDSLKALNNIPFVNLSLPGDEMLGKLIEIADTLDARIGEVEGIAKQTATFVSDVSYLTGGDLTETRLHLQTLLNAVNEYDQKVKDWQTQVTTLIKSVPVWINRGALILTVFLLWFGLSQFGLILHGLTVWRGGAPLAMLRGG